MAILLIASVEIDIGKLSDRRFASGSYLGHVLAAHLQLGPLFLFQIKHTQIVQLLSNFHYAAEHNHLVVV